MPLTSGQQQQQCESRETKIIAKQQQYDQLAARYDNAIFVARQLLELAHLTVHFSPLSTVAYQVIEGYVKATSLELYLNGYQVEDNCLSGMPTRRRFFTTTRNFMVQVNPRLIQTAHDIATQMQLDTSNLFINESFYRTRVTGTQLPLAKVISLPSHMLKNNRLDPSENYHAADRHKFHIAQSLAQIKLNTSLWLALASTLTIASMTCFLADDKEQSLWQRLLLASLVKSVELLICAAIQRYFTYQGDAMAQQYANPHYTAQEVTRLKNSWSDRLNTPSGVERLKALRIDREPLTTEQRMYHASNEELRSINKYLENNELTRLHNDIMASLTDLTKDIRQHALLVLSSVFSAGLLVQVALIRDYPNFIFYASAFALSSLVSNMFPGQIMELKTKLLVALENNHGVQLPIARYYKAESNPASTSTSSLSLHHNVSVIAKELNIKMPSVYISTRSDHSPYAQGMRLPGTTPCIVLPESIHQVDPEINEFALRHEMAHINNNDVIILGIVRCLIWASLMCVIRQSGDDWSLVQQLAISLVLPIIQDLCTMPVTRYCESRADRDAMTIDHMSSCRGAIAFFSKQLEQGQQRRNADVSTYESCKRRLFFSAAGDNRADLHHPPLSERLAMAETLQHKHR